MINSQPIIANPPGNHRHEHRRSPRGAIPVPLHAPSRRSSAHHPPAARADPPRPIALTPETNAADYDAVRCGLVSVCSGVRRRRRNARRFNGTPNRCDNASAISSGPFVPRTIRRAQCIGIGTTKSALQLLQRLAALVEQQSRQCDCQGLAAPISSAPPLGSPPLDTSLMPRRRSQRNF